MAGLIQTFQAFSGILVVCPCCGELLRVSDLSLRYTGKFERTVLDALRQKEKNLDKKEETVDRRWERFQARERQLRDEAAKRGRRKVKGLMRKLDPSMGTLRYDPQDIKALSHPVDLIVFDGLNRADRVKSIIFIGRSKTRHLATIRKSMDKVLASESYLWETVRVGADGSLQVTNK